MKAGAWGFFAPEISRDVGLSPTDIGIVAGIVLAGTALFTPLAGLFIASKGCRLSMVLGLILGAIGLLVTSAGNSLIGFSVGAVFLAASTSFSGVVPIQTLTTVWFERYRSRAMALIFTGTPIWGALSYPLYDAMLTTMTWRMAIALLTVIFPIGLVLVLAFVRNTPDDVGQPVDGIAPDRNQDGPDQGREAVSVKETSEALDAKWTTKAALLSPLFALITMSVVICTLPYLYLVTFGRLLLESIDVSMSVAVAALAGLTLATLVGRLSVSLADFVDSRVMVLVALLCNLFGISALMVSQADAMIYVSVFLIGVSFGLSFLIAPILLARAFGKVVFAPVEGVRMAIVVGLNAGLTPLFGYLVELSGSYLLPLQIILAVNAATAIGLGANLVVRRIG